MKMKVYSHSKLGTFEQCPLKFKFKYIDKLKPVIEKTIEAHLGSAVHDTLEWVYNTVKEKSKEADYIPPSLDEIMMHFVKAWQKDLSEQVLIVKKQYTQKDYLNKGIQFLADYYQQHYPFKDGTIECEKEISIILDENTRITGFIDRLVHNIEQNRYEIHDYKTAGTLPTQEKMNQDKQLALYSIAIKELYGKDKEVLLVWHYLAYNQKIISRRTDEQLEKLKEETKKLIQEIEETKEFISRKSILCEWCEFKPVCPEFNIKIDTTLTDKILAKQISKVNPFPDFEAANKQLDIY